MTKEQKCEAIARHEAVQATEMEVYNLLIDGCPALTEMTDAEIDQLMKDYDLPHHTKPNQTKPNEND